MYIYIYVHIYVYTYIYIYIYKYVYIFKHVYTYPLLPTTLVDFECRYAGECGIETRGDFDLFGNERRAGFPSSLLFPFFSSPPPLPLLPSSLLLLLSESPPPIPSSSQLLKTLTGEIGGELAPLPLLPLPPPSPLPPAAPIRSKKASRWCVMSQLLQLLVDVCCSVLQYVQCVVVCCSAVQCIAVCCSAQRVKSLLFCLLGLVRTYSFKSAAVQSFHKAHWIATSA